MKSRVFRNAAANFASALAASAVQLCTLPVLIALVGLDGYALVGFHASLLGLAAAFDLGLSVSLTRRIAMSGGEADAAKRRDLLFSYERVFMILGAFVGGSVMLSSGWISSHWLVVPAESQVEVGASILLMGMLLAARWLTLPPTAFLIGRQMQVELAVVTVGVALLANAGGVLFMMLTGTGIPGFLAWSLLVTLLQAFVLRKRCWLQFGGIGGKAAFSRGIFSTEAGFSVRLAAMGFMAVVLGHVDKILISALVPLEQFGLLSMAVLLGSGITLIVLPLFNAVIPGIYAAALADDGEALRTASAAAERLVSTAVVPIALLLIAFGGPMVHVWTGSTALAGQAGPVVALVSLGLALNALMYIPYAVQLARGWLLPSLVANALQCLLLVPMVMLLTRHFGVVGGACAGPVLAAVHLLVAVPLVYRRCLGQRGGGAFFLRIARQHAVLMVLVAGLFLAYPEDLTRMMSGALLALIVSAVAIWAWLQSRRELASALRDLASMDGQAQGAAQLPGLAQTER
jgi:O-antigen/teichoic acid export membrane protein